MAREMTPQERAEQVAHMYYSRGPTNLIDLIADALTATRRAALLEAAGILQKVYEESFDDWNGYVEGVIETLTRLAQEG